MKQRCFSLEKLCSLVHRWQNSADCTAEYESPVKEAALGSLATRVTDLMQILPIQGSSSLVLKRISISTQHCKCNPEEKRERAGAQGKLPLPFRGESVKANVQMGSCPSAVPTQNSSVRGVFGMGIAHEIPKTRQAPKSCDGPSGSAVLGLRAHCCYGDTSHLQTLTSCHSYVLL